MTQAPPPPPTPVNEADPAQQSLADALRVSFSLLRWVMIALVVAYLLSGIYRVPEQQAAVVTRFGKIVGEREGDPVKAPGVYFGWPFPIENVIKVATNQRTVDLSNAFVYQVAPDQTEGRPGPLNPEVDGSLITGDANIVHARFSATYEISDPVDFITNVGDDSTADELVVSVVEQAVVHTVAKTSADDMIGGRFDSDAARAIAQTQLDGLDAGIDLTGVRIRLPEMPLMVRDAYGLVSQAEAARGTAINQAESERTRLLGEAGGEAALPTEDGDGPLVQLIKEYEIATAVNDTARLAELDQQMQDAFRSLSIAGADRPYDVGGETARIINAAQIDKTQIIESVKTEADTVLQLKPAFDKDPTLFKQLMWQSAAREIFGEDSGIEMFYAPSGDKLYLTMNRDPNIVRKKERDRLQTETDNLRNSGR